MMFMLQQLKYKKKKEKKKEEGKKEEEEKFQGSIKPVTSNHLTGVITTRPQRYLTNKDNVNLMLYSP